MNLKETGYKDMEWIHPAQDRDSEPSGSIQGGKFLEHLRDYSLIKKN
jgi:hypothetical protein